MFLAIVASFVLIALWSPRSLYHPRELQELEEHSDRKTVLPKERPGVATIVLVAGVVFCGCYQFFKDRPEILF
jgi:hypothetical protein